MTPLLSKRNQLRERLRRDGWLIGLLAAGILACLLLSAAETSLSAADNSLAAILSSMDGAGHVEVAVSYQDEAETIPCGAVIVADGADNMLVELRLRRALSALTGLPDGKIEVFKREEGP